MSRVRREDAVSAAFWACGSGTCRSIPDRPNPDPSRSADNAPAEELDLDFEHGGVMVLDFHETPILRREGILDIPTFIESEGTGDVLRGSSLATPLSLGSAARVS